jgi:hypothetical protein
VLALPAFDVRHVTLSDRGRCFRVKQSKASFRRVVVKASSMPWVKGVVGARNVLLDGEAVRLCLVFAGQVDGANAVTVEALVERPACVRPADPS